ncbi:hypothetical protein MM300_09050 [Evansella sp. LMS18]|jgi:hypothetical protein|uniref:hypothetical protein n=1 Tax=Evansella sp. LMS18 TaxID=2924033 RepID=UPI0020D1D72A|nr:hypothetical protein [Evansella sp. LMS18]UTR12412.1 hypothetical protein MM300_09050 [Evansella sp. LMS18]
MPSVFDKSYFGTRQVDFATRGFVFTTTTTTPFFATRINNFKIIYREYKNTILKEEALAAPSL